MAIRISRLRRIAKPLACVAAVLALAAQAQAQTQQEAAPLPHKMRVVKPAAKPQVALRGSQAAPPPIKLAPSAPASSLNSGAYAAIPKDADECRAGCAHTYYFCLANNDAPSCPDTLIACETGCANPDAGL